MKINRLLILALSLSFVANNTLAQNPTEPLAQGKQSPAVAVTASVSATDSIRVAAPGQNLSIRMEIYAANGNLIFDSGLRQGSVLDWKVADASSPMTGGAYLMVTTVRDLQGKFRQRLGGISVQSGAVTLQNQPEAGLTPAQKQALNVTRLAQKVEAAEAEEAVTILRDGKDRAVVVTAHDGQNGQITSTSGALTFNTGNFFSSRATEQMRVTPDGRVGIGTDKPEATLDVAGTIRARGGIRFDDGTVLNSASLIGSSKTVVAPGPAVLQSTTQNAALAGTGTQNKIVKWLDNAGTLGDSNIFEDGTGNIGIGTNAPATLLQIGPNPGYGATNGLLIANNLTGSTYDRSFQLAPRQTNSPGTNAIMIYALPTINAGVNVPTQYGIFLDGKQGPGTIGSFAAIGTGQTPSLGATNNTHLLLGTAAVPAGNYGIYDNTGYKSYFSGSVGIGTTAPSTKLEVAGDLKISGANNGLIFPDGTKQLTAAVGAGGAMTGTGIITAINDPTTSGVISDIRLSPNVGRLNGANAWSGANAFNGLSASGAAITNVGNPVSAGDAVNKAYADSNFVKFVPGAEQLSVGDANGTAPMINLRGGSTCCSGPGGHTPAWFKVFQNGSFVATGNLGIGVSPMQGKGYRTSWDSYKGAFRSGYADNEWDDANVGFFSWAGGSNSTAVGLYALAFGDTNQAESTSSIVFGSGNQVKGAAGFAAGAGNRVCDTYGVALGNNAKSGGPLINGKCDPDTFNLRGLAAVAIGYNVTADQDHTTAMGKFASNNGFQGTFVWSDGSATASADTFRNTANNEFALRATGGFRFRTNLTGTTGCNLPAGSGVFSCTSSRLTKENFSLVNGEDLLSRLRKVPVSTWNYISEGNSTRHIGPMAEDFFDAFKLGTGNTSIGVQDLGGVSLAAIKALDQRTVQLQQKSAEVEQLRNEVKDLRSANEAMERRLAALEANAAKQASKQ
ncbi:MAG: hypothetical protein QOE77_3150 [Blastocatellia bacterium]|jgi:hypothetical protein|nr:hypothetical protein [Blastocatellia bacterium]